MSPPRFSVVNGQITALNSRPPAFLEQSQQSPGQLYWAYKTGALPD